MQDNAPAAPQRLALSVDEAAALLGISRTFAYELVWRNQLPHVRVGRRVLIPRQALDALLAGSAG